MATSAVDEIVDAVADEAVAGHRTAGTVGAMLQPLTSGTATAGAAGTITLQNTASALADFYNGNVVQIIAGTGIGQSRVITDYTITTFVASVTPNWITNPGNDSVYVVYGLGPVQVEAVTIGVIDADAIAADAIGASELAADAVVEITTSVTQELNHGTVYYVDDSMANDTGDGLTWATAKETIQAAVDLARDYTVIYIRVADAAFSEAVETDPAYDNLSLIGVSQSGRQPAWVSGAATNPCLYVNSRNTVVDNFYFQGSSNTVPLIEVSETDPNNGIGVVIKNCVFNGVGNSHSAIMLYGGIIQSQILNNRFKDFYGQTHVGYQATIWGDNYSPQSAISVDIIGNSFFDCIDGIVLQGVSCLIKDNVFTDVGFVQGTTKVIDMAASGSSGGNIITGNVFEHLSYELTNANGYYGSSDDNWSGNYCLDGLSGYGGQATVPLVAGRTYSLSKAVTVIGDDDLFSVAGGPISITSFTGYVVTTIAGGAETTKITLDHANDDFDFSTAVNITGFVRGSRVIFSEANPAVLSELGIGASGGGNPGFANYTWFCPAGMIQHDDAENTSQAGAVTWYMTFIPLTDGVSVTVQ